MYSAKHFVLLIIIVLSLVKVQAQSTFSFAPSSVLAEGKWVKIALSGKEDGIYEITYKQLSGMGFHNPENVGVYGFGGHILSENFSSQEHFYDDLPEIATYHDKAGERILFYGRGLISWEWDKTAKHFVHRQNPYATKACYFVHEKESEALTMDFIESGEHAEEDVFSFDEHYLYESELINIGKTGREMYGESFLHNQSQTFTFGDKLISDSVFISVNFVALSPSETTFSVKYANGDSKSAKIKGATSSYTYSVESTLSEYFQNEKELVPAIKITFSGNASVKNAHLNFIQIEGKRSITLDNNESFRLFRNTISQEKLIRYNFQDLPTSALVWDVSNPLSPKILRLDESHCFNASEKGIKEYALVDVSSKKSFNSVEIVESVGGNGMEVANQNLHATDSVDLVIVSAQGLKFYAQQLADFRAKNDGMRVKVVTPEEIYNEYSSGTADATAIRLYMKQVFGNRENEGFLLLFGDGHYDNRKIETNPNYLICYETESSLVETSSTVHDDYFGFLQNNELKVGVGRIPVHSAKDAEAVVKKIIEYSSNYHYGKWKNRLCFLSDDDKIGDSGSDAPNVHIRHNEQVISEIQDTQGHKEFVYQKIYLPAYTQTKTASGTDYPDANKEFLEALQQGALVVNYAGHGATYSITHEMLMTTAKAAQLNMKNLPLWITASCDISRWDNDEESLGETLLLNNNGGAIALISTTRVVYASQNLSLNLAIAKTLFKRKADGTRYRLGDILREAKQSLGSDYNKLNFCLLGDPTMLLSYPQYQMEVTEIGYADRVTVKGRVIDPSTKETATNFNGLVYPIVYDAPDSITADKGLWQEPAYKFSSRTKKVFSGSDVVSNGLFQFSYFTPKDVSEYTSDGLINLYACNEANEEANGYQDSLIIIKPVPSEQSDSIGPEILYIFVNSPDFKDSETVGSTPYFYAKVHDVSGFNATGNSIGHDVTLTIRCTNNHLFATKQYNLNDYLTTFTGDPTTGDVQFSIPALEDGEYEMTFKIWDSMNNSSDKSIRFVVKKNMAHYPILVQAYPTPIRQGEETTFRVLHKLPKSPTKIRLQIYTETGIKILDKAASTNSAEVVITNGKLQGASTISWTATVPPGPYIYKVYLSSENDEETSESKILIVK